MSSYGGSRSVNLMELTYANYEPTCHLCGEWINTELTGNYGPSVDHIIARSNGGTDDLPNLKPAHTLCNSIRGNRPIEDYRAANTNELDWLVSLRE